jgi:hypothetical protein
LRSVVGLLARASLAPGTALVVGGFFGSLFNEAATLTPPFSRRTRSRGAVAMAVSGNARRGGGAFNRCDGPP